MTHKIKRILTATLAMLIVASISACTDSPTDSSTSKNESEVVSSVPETSVTDTSVPETTVHTEDASVETPKPETTVQIETEVPETSSVPETEAPKPETTTVQTEAPIQETTTTTVTTKPAPEWTETKVNGTKYVNTSCYSRKKAVLGAETVKIYNVNDKVTVTAKTDTGYFKLNDGSFIHGDYLSDSKVTVQTTITTTTTTKKQETPSQTPSQTEKVILTVYTAKDDVWIYDVNGTKLTQFFPYTGTELEVIEILKDKGLYKITGGDCVKISETTKTNPIEKIYYYPFDLEALRQHIIDDAVNNYGLVYNDSPEWTLDNATWFAPSVIDKNESPAKLKQDLASLVSFSCKFGGMQAGDTFKIYIEKIPYERAKNFNYGYDPFNGELAYSKEEFEQLDAYAIYFFRGGNGNPND